MDDVETIPPQRTDEEAAFALIAKSWNIREELAVRRDQIEGIEKRYQSTNFGPEAKIDLEAAVKGVEEVLRSVSNREYFLHLCRSEPGCVNCDNHERSAGAAQKRCEELEKELRSRLELLPEHPDQIVESLQQKLRNVQDDYLMLKQEAEFVRQWGAGHFRKEDMENVYRASSEDEILNEIGARRDIKSLRVYALSFWLRYSAAFDREHFPWLRMDEVAAILERQEALEDYVSAVQQQESLANTGPTEGLDNVDSIENLKKSWNDLEIARSAYNNCRNRVIREYSGGEPVGRRQALPPPEGYPTALVEEIKAFSLQQIQSKKDEVPSAPYINEQQRQNSHGYDEQNYQLMPISNGAMDDEHQASQNALESVIRASEDPSLSEQLREGLRQAVVLLMGNTTRHIELGNIESTFDPLAKRKIEKLEKGIQRLQKELEDLRGEAKRLRGEKHACSERMMDYRSEKIKLEESLRHCEELYEASKSKSVQRASTDDDGASVAEATAEDGMDNDVSIEQLIGEIQELRKKQGFPQRDWAYQDEIRSLSQRGPAAEGGLIDVEHNANDQQEIMQLNEQLQAVKTELKTILELQSQNKQSTALRDAIEKYKRQMGKARDRFNDAISVAISESLRAGKVLISSHARVPGGVAIAGALDRTWRALSTPRRTLTGRSESEAEISGHWVPTLGDWLFNLSHWMIKGFVCFRMFQLLLWLLLGKALEYRLPIYLTKILFDIVYRI